MNDLAHSPQNARPIDLARERVEALTKTANDWLKAVPDITDEETARLADDFLNQIQAELKSLDKAEKAEKDPLRKQIADIGLSYAPLVSLLETAKGLIGPKIRAWLARKQAALDAEKMRQAKEAARLIREAQEAERKAMARATVENQVAVEAAKAAAFKAVAAAEAPPKRAQIRGNYSQRARSIRKLWRAEITDLLQLYVYYCDHPDVRDLLQRLANAEAPAANREGREIPGCKLVEREISA